MKTRVWILLGGMYSFDGYVTSRGMLSLESEIAKIPGVDSTEHWLWADYMRCYQQIMSNQEDRNILLGFSGGATHATWVAVGYEYAKAKIHLPQPKIDLLIGLDPSPASASFDLSHSKVKRAICHYSQISLVSFGLGGGQWKGPMVKNVPNNIAHIAVQYAPSVRGAVKGEIAREISGG